MTVAPRARPPDAAAANRARELARLALPGNERHRRDRAFERFPERGVLRLRLFSRPFRARGARRGLSRAGA